MALDSLRRGRTGGYDFEGNSELIDVTCSKCSEHITISKEEYENKTMEELREMVVCSFNCNEPNYVIIN